MFCLKKQLGLERECGRGVNFNPQQEQWEETSEQKDERAQGADVLVKQSRLTPVQDHSLLSVS